MFKIAIVILDVKHNNDIVKLSKINSYPRPGFSKRFKNVICFSESFLWV